MMKRAPTPRPWKLTRGIETARDMDVMNNEIQEQNRRMLRAIAGTEEDVIPSPEPAKVRT